LYGLVDVSHELFHGDSSGLLIRPPSQQFLAGAVLAQGAFFNPALQQVRVCTTNVTALWDA
jgi:hypothetical protein